MESHLDARSLDKVFRFSLFLKAGLALAEIVGGVVVYVTTQQFWVNVVRTVTADELAEDPRDIFANYLRRTVLHFSGSSMHFAAWYLFGHGIVKLWLIVGLLRKRLWYYPVAMVVFAAFVVYQLYRFVLQHSMSLLVITGLDLLVIALTWYEFRVLRSAKTRVA